MRAQHTGSKPDKKKWYKTWWGLIIVLCFFPFSISYWLLKRDWNVLLRIGAVIFFWFVFLLFVSVDSYVRDTTPTATDLAQTDDVRITPQPTPIKTNKERLEALEAEKNRLATEYCEQRAKSTKYYPLPETTEVQEGAIEYEINDDLKKQGTSLTQDDCRLVIDYLYYLDEKYALVINIDFQKVIERKYWIGMSMAELYPSLGYPNKINTTNYGAGEEMQNVYYKDSYGASAYYIYVEDGVVTSYQDF